MSSFAYVIILSYDTLTRFHHHHPRFTIMQQKFDFQKFFKVHQNPSPYLKSYIVLNVLKSTTYRRMSNENIARGFHEVPWVFEIRILKSTRSRWSLVIPLSNGEERCIWRLIPPCKVERNIIVRHPSLTQKIKIERKTIVLKQAIYNFGRNKLFLTKLRRQMHEEIGNKKKIQK